MSSTNISSSNTTAPSGIYYLHPSDNPGSLIASVLLKGDNYTEWATELSNSIQAKQKLGFIEGTVDSSETFYGTGSLSMASYKLNDSRLD